MCFVVIVDGRISPVFWFQTDTGENVSGNGERYLDMLQTAIHLAIQEIEMETGKQCWMQQDGAPAHTKTEVMKRLRQNYPGTRISCLINMQCAWPAHSRDLNPLVYYLWSNILRQQQHKEFNGIQDVRESVEAIAAAALEDET